jgi:ATP-dependent Clp protease ATP-binding subunit ClpA
VSNVISLPREEECLLEHLAGLEPFLLGRVIGQDDAAHRVAGALCAAELGLNETGPRPRATFLLMGPSGVGKSESSKAFTEYLIGPDRLAMIFCNQYPTAADVPELVREIERALRAHPEGCTLLFDEFEKARGANDLFLSLLDEGKLTLPGGERLSLTACYVVLTSNIGSSDFSKMEQTTYSVMQQYAYDQARKTLRPELFNRLTETIVYRPLSQAVQIRLLSRLVDAKLLYLGSRFERIFGRKLPVPLSIDEKPVHAHLLKKGFTQVGGARHLREELNRQFNAAVNPWFLVKKRMPEQGRFFRNVEHDCLELR